jgi:hypothetical protein
MKLLAKYSKIILVGVNKGEIGLIEEFFNDAKLRINFHIAENGEEAIRFLCGEYKFFGYLPKI